MYEPIDIKNIPSKDLLSKGKSDEIDLEEYVTDNLILSPGGINKDKRRKTVNCCTTCLQRLRKGKLPPLSIANNFQIGKTPPELADLTLPEKLLISVNRPKIHVIKLRSSNGPGTRQRGLIGNTITFPQNIVQVAASLPASPDILVDHLKVVFIGNTRPTHEMLKKVLTVRRDKVYKAVEFLIANNPLYSDVTLSTVNLPTDDIPEQILQTLHTHEDEDNQDASEHSTYTPQSDINDVPSDTVIMDCTGMIDMEGSSVRSSDQMNSAINTLQGTIYVPHGSMPVNEYNNPNLWLGSYPWLFPYGRGGPEIDREVQVSLKAYIKHLLLLADRKFARDISLKFHAFNILQRRDVSLHTTLQVRRSGFHSTAARIDSLDNESLAELQQSVESNTPITDPNLRTFMNSLSSTGAYVKGSPYQKKSYRREIFGLMIKYGTPVLWITLSPAVSHSPIFMQLAGHEVDLSNLPSHVERAKIVANDPVAAAMYYKTVINAFTTYLLGYKQSGGGIFGKPSAYYGMTEEQGTGTLHNHMLVWLHGFESASKLRSDLEDKTFQENLIIYLESIIKQGYLGNDNIDENVDVSEVSCKYPVNPNDYPNDEGFEEELNKDVNKLVRVANTHSCRETCYKRRKNRKCRFEYPRELVAESIVNSEIVMLKRTHEMINNFNPFLMTCIRSNHDIKIIFSGKDGKNIAFYVTDYATKSELSTKQMVPLIAASKKKIDEDASLANTDIISRTKAFITKCLNRITTEKEISGSHVSHFLLGNLDKETSHSFTRLNLHSALAWLANEITNSEDEPVDNDNSNEGVDENPGNSNDPGLDNENDADGDNDDNVDNSSTYNISIGNTGFVLVNQMTDYTNRGDALSHMCLYEYCSKVFKTKFTVEEKEKYDKRKCDKHAKGRKPQDRHSFSDVHPQSETHWQIERKEGLVPSLSKLPPNCQNNEEKFQKCMLLLFKPFSKLSDLFNGTSWDESYETADFGENKKYVENIQEMHMGLKEREDARDNDDENCVNDDDTVDDVDDELENDLNALKEVELDSQTNQAVDIVKQTGWLDESTSTQPIIQPTFDPSCPLPNFNQWKKDIRNQNRNKLDDVDTNEDDVEDMLLNPTQTVAEDRDVGFTTDVCNDMDLDEIALQIILRYSLNRKQRYAFEIAIKNVIKRERNEETQQFLGYIGGPGGTGKSQVIKAIVAFHEEVKIRGKLKMCAYTGTAAKYIGGSTTATLFGTRSKNRSTLEKRFANVNTIIVDEVSMIGCIHLKNISKCLTNAKHANPDLPFGGVDVMFFGDFMQFPPIGDYPLYSDWDDESVTESISKSEQDKKLGQHLWKQVNRIVLLDEQMRITDRPYQELLNRLREGRCTDSDFEMLNKRVVGQSVDEITRIAGNPIIAPGNKLVMALNNAFATSHSQHKTVHLSTAQDRIKKRFNLPPNLATMIKDYPSTRTNGLPRELPLYVGMPVILTDNIAVELGLTNGTTGMVKSIQFHCDEVVTEEEGFNHLDNIPDCVIVELDDITMNSLDGLSPNNVPIFPKARSFGVKIPGRKDAINISRTHFPLVPRFACTAHKSQGQTLTKAIVDLVVPENWKGGVEINFSYVPLSRVRALNDLTILRPFDRSILKAPVNRGCSAMMSEFISMDECKDM